MNAYDWGRIFEALGEYGKERRAEWRETGDVPYLSAHEIARLQRPVPLVARPRPASPLQALGALGIVGDVAVPDPVAAHGCFRPHS